jgi:hypothetical protein
MTPMEMDKELGLTNRMRKVANNLRKFNQLEGEKANLQKYHYDMIDRGVEEIQEEGVRVYCRRAGEKFGVKEGTMLSDYAIMKRYGLING